MKSMVCLFVLAVVAAASANPGGLTGVPHGAVPLSLGLGVGHGPIVQPIAPTVVRHAQPIVAAVGHGPLITPVWGGKWAGAGYHG